MLVEVAQSCYLILSSSSIPNCKAFRPPIGCDEEAQDEEEELSISKSSWLLWSLNLYWDAILEAKILFYSDIPFATLKQMGKCEKRRIKFECCTTIIITIEWLDGRLNGKTGGDDALKLMAIFYRRRSWRSWWGTITQQNSMFLADRLLIGSVRNISWISGGAVEILKVVRSGKKSLSSVLR